MVARRDVQALNLYNFQSLFHNPLLKRFIFVWEINKMAHEVCSKPEINLFDCEAKSLA